MERCLANSGCQAFTYDASSTNINCWLKTKAGSQSESSGLTTGIRCSFDAEVG